ncbi:hypothetical protein ACI2LD_01750 [Enterococcus casseliflavus]|uniref:hypothetical protein n=1 Tax=Enterococcus casseliflavus TaxID=37734 RepID=UPI0037B8ABFF
MGKRIKIGLLLVAISLFVLVGCGNKPNKDVQEVIDAIVDERNQRYEEHDCGEDDLSLKVYYSELLDAYVVHAFVPRISDRESSRGEIKQSERLYSYHLKELDWTSSISQLPSILTEGNYEEVYRSGKFVE